ncbi:alpha/beta-hydrolase [Polychaeton citri CBS 116435]|uniref:Alpha/beta-hydrolase n=1 Tax=Polychaeton citri CBS 116435 TaxID=1314669 RepID=A0A9P4UU40_9PEZI|nr:alpha/beta-hydrolase [Polychaeton citri CBS 116435]
MSAIPFIGRLHLVEYLALCASFALLILEVVVRTITLALPGPIIRFCYLTSRRAFNSLSSPRSRRNRSKKKSVSSPIAQAQDFVELCELYGYYAEEHIVQTKDGYLLGLHRLGWKRGEEETINTGQTTNKKVVYLHHGLMMNSEVWVCLTERERCLPFVLVEQGYDVWLGNNRGNKYSKKSLRHSPTEAAFWDFSMDQFAFHDIPDSIDYILSTTQQPSLSYIGFSQGTAQAFAALSIHPTLNHKVDVFVALAPAMAPPGLASGVVSSFVKSSPEILFLAFGRHAILGSATMWQALLYPGIFIYFIDKSLKFLFNWSTQNITAHQKLAAYPHLYSFSSTKSVVHWFQIIRNGTFQMYDDEVTTPWQFSSGSKYYKVAKFPTRNIKTPIVLVYGGSDSLVDIKLMLKELPRHTVARGIEKYEHLDLLWASDVDQLVFPHVLEALENFGAPLKTKVAALGWRHARPGVSTSPVGSQPPGYSEDETRLLRSHEGSSFAFDRLREHRPSTADELEALDESEYDDTDNERHPFVTPERLRDHSIFTSSTPPSRFPGNRLLNSSAASRTITTITRAAPTESQELGAIRRASSSQRAPQRLEGSTLRRLGDRSSLRMEAGVAAQGARPVDLYLEVVGRMGRSAQGKSRAKSWMCIDGMYIELR